MCYCRTTIFFFFFVAVRTKDGTRWSNAPLFSRRRNTAGGSPRKDATSHGACLVSSSGRVVLATVARVCIVYYFKRKKVSPGCGPFGIHGIRVRVCRSNRRTCIRIGTCISSTYKLWRSTINYRATSARVSRPHNDRDAHRAVIIVVRGRLRIRRVADTTFFLVDERDPVPDPFGTFLIRVASRVGAPLMTIIDGVVATGINLNWTNEIAVPFTYRNRKFLVSYLFRPTERIASA